MKQCGCGDISLLSDRNSSLFLFLFFSAYRTHPFVFSIGFGPCSVLVSYKRSNTVYRNGLLSVHAYEGTLRQAVEIFSEMRYRRSLWPTKNRSLALLIYAYGTTESSCRESFASFSSCSSFCMSTHVSAILKSDML